MPRVDMYCPDCLKPFPADLADSLLAMALERMGLAAERLENQTDGERRQLDEMLWRLITAADVGDRPCAD